MAGIQTGNSVNFIPPLVMDPSNPQRLYFGNSALYQTNNGAQQWVDISGFLGGKATAIQVAPSNPNVVYVASVPRLLRVSTNALTTAPTWIDRSSGLPDRYITQIAVAPQNVSLAYVT